MDLSKQRSSAPVSNLYDNASAAGGLECSAVETGCLSPVLPDESLIPCIFMDQGTESVVVDYVMNAVAWRPPDSREA